MQNLSTNIVLYKSYSGIFQRLNVSFESLYIPTVKYSTFEQTCAFIYKI